MKERCERCKRFVSYPIQLELHTRKLFYTLPGLIPAKDSQGCFEFHTSCALKELEKNFKRKAKS